MSKQDKLIKWLNKKIEEKMLSVNKFLFVNRDDKEYDNLLDNSREQLSDISFMIYLRELLLDEKSTTQMRENIEYTICKVFGTKYSEYLEDYI